MSGTKFHTLTEPPAKSWLYVFKFLRFFRQQTRKQNVLHWMAASISRIQPPSVSSLIKFGLLLLVQNI
jgi:hypothetical protein